MVLSAGMGKLKRPREVFLAGKKKKQKKEQRKEKKNHEEFSIITKMRPKGVSKDAPNLFVPSQWGRHTIESLGTAANLNSCKTKHLMQPSDSCNSFWGNAL